MPDFSFLDDSSESSTIRINTNRRSAKKRVAPQKTKPNPAVGCLTLALLFGGCFFVVSGGRERPREAVRQALPVARAQPRVARPDDYVPPRLGNNPEAFFGQLYRDLKQFRDDPWFRDVGFGQGQRFYPWMATVQKYAMRETAETKAAWGEGWITDWARRQNENSPHGIALPGDLLVLGLDAYSKPKWPFNEMSQVWESQFGGDRQ